VSSSSTETLIDVTMPQMGVSVAEGTVVAWRVGVGDPIAAEETICEISTDKIDTEVPSPASGVVSEILVQVDETVDVGVVLARIDVGGGGGARRPAPAAEPAESPPTPTTPHDAPENGAATGADGAAAGADGAATGAETPPRPASNGEANGRRYSPVVQRIAAEHDIDLSTVPGTGRGGRVRKQDVLAALESGAGAGAADVEDAPLHIESPYRPDPVPPADGGTLSRVRRQIGEHMKRSLDESATCTTWTEVDMSRIEAARVRLGLTALPFVARASIAALREHPSLNAWLEGSKYTRHTDINLGIAVSLGDDGLIVPVVQRAHELSVEGLSSQIRDLARRARARQLKPDEVKGGTFTITNPGQYGSIMATPIINQPQIAILDLEAVVKRAVVLTDADGNDSIAIRPMTILGLSWDHRALDGAEAAQFLAALKRHLEGWTGA
jgi:pyruvate/2-oxoglutarate dehydrogenase complex dihydrolipoamide acyltransferase (E2) component